MGLRRKFIFLAVPKEGGTMRPKGWFILYFWLFVLSIAAAVVTLVFEWYLFAGGFSWSAYVWYHAMMAAHYVWAIERRIEKL